MIWNKYFHRLWSGAADYDTGESAKIGRSSYRGGYEGEDLQGSSHQRSRPSFIRQKKAIFGCPKKPQLFYVYTVDVKVKNEAEIKKCRQKLSNLSFLPEEKGYSLTALGTKSLKHRPVIIGTGPAGLFCGYELARLGYRPILLERGASVEERIKDVEEFWASGVLNCKMQDRKSVV